MRTTLRATLAGGLFLLGLASPALAAEHVVNIVDYRYVPAELRISPGDTVVWVNGEKRTSHSVVFLGTGEESERFFPDERWSKAFPEKGRFDYTCGPHPEMKGAVIVGD